MPAAKSSDKSIDEAKIAEDVLTDRKDTVEAISDKRSSYDFGKPVDRADPAVELGVLPNVATVGDGFVVHLVPDGSVTRASFGGKDVILTADEVRALSGVFDRRIKEL